MQTVENSVEDTLTLLSVPPDRIGHGTFLNDEARALVLEKNIAIELCLTSNLL
jgi:adenosine deaminase